MAKIEQHPFAGIPFVMLDDLPLDIHTFGDHLGQKAAGILFFQPVKQRCAADAAVLYSFPHAVGKIMGGKSVDGKGIDEHQARLPKGAHQIFALG